MNIGNKLECRNCGLIIEPGLQSVINHHFNECEAVSIVKINDTYYTKKYPIPSFSIVNPIDNINENVKFTET